MQSLVVGGSGGIGGALVAQLLERGDRVIATWHRSQPGLEHPRLQWHPLDLRDETSIGRLAGEVTDLRMLINTVGLLHDAQHRPEKALSQIDGEFFLQSMAVNALPTLLLARAFRSALSHGQRAFFATISARVGSIGDNGLGGWYSYRCSKAALNMALKTLSIEWSRTLPEVCVAGLHPGTVNTGLSRPFQRNVPPEKLFAPGYSASRLLAVLEALTPADSGAVWAWDGKPVPW